MAKITVTLEGEAVTRLKGYAAHYGLSLDDAAFNLVNGGHAKWISTRTYDQTHRKGKGKGATKGAKRGSK